MNPIDPDVTTAGMLVALNQAGHFLLGSKTIRLASGLREPITTTIARQSVAAGPTAVAMNGTTLKPGDPAVKVDGTLVALDAAGMLVISSKTIPFITKSAKSLVTTIAGQPITAAANAIEMASTTLKPGDAAFSVHRTKVSLNTAGHFVLGSQTYTISE